MKANEAKSKFVYPDKLYARCKDNKTLDISYAPQNMESVEYVRTDIFIKRAKKWFKGEGEYLDANGIIHYGIEDFEDFKEAMKL